ncbi:nuclear transport factor 2 family protein [Streptomyces sp. SCA3-4]|uniref:nuclear transport factor 2 family protein n=1 Tax=Streptomyces sichuanensis TaxID=2871810 RepID=UPI001CE3847F|nr:nuclear transport factor 2 family protein [Streptomyces sichuanensis]MCA6095295.1 nuclear transport factor 2 family protein [Streptomyces sichuanensis]
MGNVSGSHTRAVVQEFLTRFAEGVPDRIAALFAEQVDWLIAGGAVVPWLRPRSTRADVAGHFRELAEGMVPLDGGPTVEAVVVDGGEAMLTGHVSGVVRTTGKTFRSPFAMRLTVEDGLITRFCLYEDSLTIADACTPQPQP